MTIAEVLKAKGLDDDAINGILADMKKNGIFTASEENLDVRYGKLRTDYDSMKKQVDAANTTIADLQKANQGNEGLQQRVTDYQTQVDQLQKELAQARIDAAVQVGLLAAHAADVDYLTFKLKEKGELELDEGGKIKGWDDKIAALQTQFPTQFESAGGRKYQENKLPDQQNDGGGAEPKSLAEALQMQYETK